MRARNGEVGMPCAETDIQITACGPVAREVVSLNLRRWSLVSCEKVYSRASELCDGRVSAGVVGCCGRPDSDGGVMIREGKTIPSRRDGLV